jgi:hypothetical protein
MDTPSPTAVLRNAALELTVTVAGGGQVDVVLRDVAAGISWASGAYIYRAAQRVAEGDLHVAGLAAARCTVSGERLLIEGTLAGLEVRHEFHLPADRPLLEERLLLTNNGAEAVALSGFAFGLRRAIADNTGALLPDRAADRVAAVPFRHKASDPGEVDMDFGLADLLGRLGRVARVNWACSSTTRRRWSSACWRWRSSRAAA